MYMLFQVECGNLHLLQPGTNFLALRCITRKPLKYFLEKRLETFTDYDETSGTSEKEESVYHGQDYKRLFNLARCENGLEERMEAYMVAVYLLRILQQMEYFGPRSDKSSLTEEEVYIGMLLAHFVQVAERNSQSMNEVGTVALSSEYGPQTPAYASTQYSRKFLQAHIFPWKILHIINIRKDGIEICTGLLTEEIRA